MTSHKWKVLYDSEHQNLSTEKIINILIENRGIKTKKDKSEFLNPGLQNISSETTGIDVAEVKKTIDRIQNAIKANEKIIIYGDYDVDGICGTAILWETLFDTIKM